MLVAIDPCVPTGLRQDRSKAKNEGGAKVNAVYFEEGTNLIDEFMEASTQRWARFSRSDCEAVTWAHSPPISMFLISTTSVRR